MVQETNANIKKMQENQLMRMADDMENCSKTVSMKENIVKENIAS